MTAPSPNCSSPQNKQLAQENKKLREQSSVLEAEKRELARRLVGSAPQSQAPSSRKEEEEEEGPQEWFGSAVPTVSLQQKRTPVSLLQLWTTVRYAHHCHLYHSLISLAPPPLHAP